jgi:hypothetical protein
MTERPYEFQRTPDPLAKNVYLANLSDRNEVLFYRLLSEHLAEMLPIVHTPTVGKAIERYSHEYRRPRGVFLSVDHPDLVEDSLRPTPGGSCSGTPTSAAPSTTTCRAPPRWCWRRRSRPPERAGPAWPTSGWSSTAPAPPAWASPTCSGRS